MKSKQCLDVHQMQHLQELGLELKDTMLYWIKPLDAVIGIVVGLENDWQLDFIDDKKKKYLKYIPAYTLQDVLGALPKMIYPFPVHKIGFELWIGSGKIFYANMFNLEDVLKVRYDKELIDAAYELLVWCVENKFVETDKNK